MPISQPVKTRKPKLASGDRIVVDTNGGGSAGLGSQSGVISTRSTSEALPKRALRTVLGLILLGLGMVFLTYVVLATTVFVIMRADGHNVAVLRSTFPVGSAPANSLVYVSSSPADLSLTGKAEEAVFGVPTGSVVRIVAGPSGTVATDKNGHIAVNGTSTNYIPVGKAFSRHLDHEYVAICITGACEQGAAVMVGENNIIGEVKGYLTTTGIAKPEASNQ